MTGFYMKCNTGHNPFQWVNLVILIVNSELAEAATGGVLWKKVFLNIPQVSQENICAGVSDTGIFLWKLRHF